MAEIYKGRLQSFAFKLNDPAFSWYSKPLAGGCSPYALLGGVYLKGRQGDEAMTVYRLNDLAVEVPDRQTGEFAYIAPTACVIGKVRLLARSSIWFGAVLRGDNELIEIGNNSNIQDGCICHTDMGYPLTVGENCTVGHRAVLHGCTYCMNYRLMNTVTSMLIVPRQVKRHKYTCIVDSEEHIAFLQMQTDEALLSAYSKSVLTINTNVIRKTHMLDVV